MLQKRPDDLLVSSIFNISRLIREKMIDTKAEDSSSMLQIKTLGIVADLKNPSMKEIADFLHIHSASATDIINRLVKNGQLMRTKDKADGRIVRLALTPQGKKMLSLGMRKVSRKLKDFLDVLTSREKNEFNEILTKILERTNAHF